MTLTTIGFGGFVPVTETGIIFLFFYAMVRPS
eukprot:SAG11_NODE_10912_length_797_cov_0.886819_1_plen_31_part_10